MTVDQHDLRRRILDRVLPVLDVLAAPIVYLAARLLRLVRRLTFERLPICAFAIDKANIYPLIDHYYEPLFNRSRLKRLSEQIRDLPEMDLNEEASLAYLADIARPAEVRNLYPWNDDGSGGFHFDNELFGFGDAEVLHGIIRKERPRLTIEIGCGWSSRIIAQALAMNAGELGWRGRHVCVEPHLPFDFSAPGAEVVSQPVEHYDPARLLDLQRGDVVFIDSSHMIRPEGDVLYEIQELLPRLGSGVLVHFHDIFSPRDYSDRLVRRHRVFWNEQYLLEAFLVFNHEFEVILPLNHLWHSYRDSVAKVCPRLAERPEAEPSSFWIRRK